MAVVSCKEESCHYHHLVERNDGLGKEDCRLERAQEYSSGLDWFRHLKASNLGKRLLAGSNARNFLWDCLDLRHG